MSTESDKIKKRIIQKAKTKSVLSKSLGNINNKSNSKNKISERFEGSIEKNKSSYFDKIEIVDNSLVIKLKNVDLITNNILLRVHNKEIYKYKKSWEDRIKRLYMDFSEKYMWDFENVFCLEFLYSIPKRKFQDIDGLNAALKAVIDGLVLSGIIKNDKQENVPIQLPYQVEGDGDLVIVITPISDPVDYFTGTFRKLMEK